MYIVAWVLGLISLLAVMTVAKMEQFVAAQSLETLSLGLKAASREADNEGQMKIYNILSSYEGNKPVTIKENTQDGSKGGQKTTSKLPTEELFLDLIPHNARLNLAFMYPRVGDASSQKESVEPKPHYEIAARLLRILYQDCDFFQAVPNAEYAVLDQLKKYSAPIKNDHTVLAPSVQPLKSVEDLALVQFDDKIVQEIFYHMLKGGELLREDGSILGYPSLFEHVIIKPKNTKQSFNVHHAAQEILEAAIDNRQAVEELCQLRETLYTEGRKVNRNGLNKTTQFLDEAQVEKVLGAHGVDYAQCKGLLDFSTYRPAKDKILEDAYVTGVDKENRMKVKKRIVVDSSAK